ncbi:MAG: DMT family transporter [Afipia sp.]|nr:DMT family transporter [Afipia sp.]
MLTRFSRDLTDRSARLAGIGLMLLGVLLFSIGDALGKHIVTAYAVGQLLLLRSIASLILLSPTIWRNRADFEQIERPWLQFFRVSLSSGEVLMFFWATVYLPLADIITFYLASPIFVTAGSAIFLKERVGWRRWSAVLLGFVGVIIALQPSVQTLTWPALIALTGSVLFAIQMIVTRSLRRTSDVVLAASQFVSTLVLGAILTAIAGWKTPTSFDFALFLVAGLIAIGALMSVNRSLILAPATVVVPYQYSMIIWAVIFGYLVFNDVPTIHVLIGAAVIIAAGIYIFLRERQLKEEEPVMVPPPA